MAFAFGGGGRGVVIFQKMFGRACGAFHLIGNILAQCFGVQTFTVVWPQFQAATTQLDAPQDQRLLIAGILGTVSGLLVLVIVATFVVSFFAKKIKDDALRLPLHRHKNGTWGKGPKDVFAMSENKAAV